MPGRYALSRKLSIRTNTMADAFATDCRCVLPKRFHWHIHFAFRSCGCSGNLWAGTRQPPHPAIIPHPCCFLSMSCGFDLRLIRSHALVPACRQASARGWMGRCVMISWGTQSGRMADAEPMCTVLEAFQPHTHDGRCVCDGLQMCPS